MSCYVYLAPTQARDRFKVGFSVSPAERLASLVDSVDLGSTWVLDCPSGTFARGLEQTLHFMFKAHRVGADHDFDGHTEWFAWSGWEPMVSFVQSNRNQLGYEQMVRPLDSRHVPRGKEPTLSIRLPRAVRKSLDKLAERGPYNKHGLIVAAVAESLERWGGDYKVVDQAYEAVDRFRKA